MATILDTASIYFDDVNLIAQPAAIQSRSEVPPFTDRIFVSPMEAVVGESFIKEASLLGLSVCTPKFGAIDKSLQIYSASQNKDNTYASIGLNDWDRAAELAKLGVKNWLIDCANGYLPQIKTTIYRLCNTYKVKKLMIGNVMSLSGVNLYKDVARENNCLMKFYIRVGIGNGSPCATSFVTGFNRGNITELIECSKAKEHMFCELVSDGGIKDGGCAAKAFGAGCFEGKMKVKTKEDLKNIKDIKVGDLVLTHTNSYKKVNKIYRYAYEGKLKVINNIKCTNNHEFYVVHNRHKNVINENNISEYAEWIEAEKLTTEYSLVEMG